MPPPVAPPIAPMLAKPARSLPGEGYHYEPKWDGFRALAFRDGASIDLRSRNDRRLARYFPELVEALAAVGAPRFVLDGEIVVLGERGLDFAALMARLHPAPARIERLRRETPALYVAFDLLAEGDHDLRGAPFAERRARLVCLLRDAPAAVQATPLTEDPSVAADWLARLHGGGIDGVVAKDPALPYRSNQRAMIKVKRARTADPVVAGFRFHGDRPIVGSLLLGLYDEHDRLVHFGVASQFTDEVRRALAAELAPRAVPLERHPWEHGFGLDRSPLGRLRGSAGRWIPGEMPRDWIPLRPELVCEVEFDVLDGRRLRHPARFLRWRPDRDPRSCRFDQLEEAAPPDVRAMLAS